MVHLSESGIVSTPAKLAQESGWMEGAGGI